VKPRLRLLTVAVLDMGAFSVLLWDSVPFAVSLERTHENLRLVIPPGLLLCTRDWFHHGGYETFKIHIEKPGEKDRRVLFHIANVEMQLEGCIGVAEKFGRLDGVPAVLNSADGFKEFMQLTSGIDSFWMEVIRDRAI
jgi:Family of unknown function (DUF5675)